MSRKYHLRVSGETGRQQYDKHLPGDCRITRYVSGEVADQYTIPATALSRDKYLEFPKVRPTIDTGARYPRWSGK